MTMIISKKKKKNPIFKGNDYFGNKKTLHNQ